MDRITVYITVEKGEGEKKVTLLEEYTVLYSDLDDLEVDETLAHRVADKAKEQETLNNIPF